MNLVRRRRQVGNRREKKLIIYKQSGLRTLHGVVFQLFMKCFLWTMIRSLFTRLGALTKKSNEPRTSSASGRQPPRKEVNHLQTMRTTYFAWGCFSTFYEVHPLDNDPVPFHTSWRVCVPRGVGISLRLRIPCAPLTKTPSISAVADGPVISTAYFAVINRESL